MTAELWAIPAVLLVLLVIGLIALARGRSRPMPPPMSTLDTFDRPARQGGAPEHADEADDNGHDQGPDTEPDTLSARREAAAQALKLARQRAAADAARLDALRQSRAASGTPVVTPLRRAVAPARHPAPEPGAASAPPPPASARPEGWQRPPSPASPPASPPAPPPALPPAPAQAAAPALPPSAVRPWPPALPPAPRDPAPVPTSPFLRTTPLPAPALEADVAPARASLPAPAGAASDARPVAMALPAPLPTSLTNAPTSASTSAPPAPRPAPLPPARPPAAIAAPAQAVRAVDAPHPAAALTVLVVDDSKVVRVKTSRLLEKHHYRVLLADDGLTALQALAGDWPDLVITDVEMPGLDGFGLTQRLRALPQGLATPVIMITSSNDRHRDEAARVGVNVLLGKPYPEAQLLAEVERALGHVASPAPAGLTMQ